MTSKAGKPTRPAPPREEGPQGGLGRNPNPHPVCSAGAVGDEGPLGKRGETLLLQVQLEARRDLHFRLPDRHDRCRSFQTAAGKQKKKKNKTAFRGTMGNRLSADVMHATPP